MHAESVTLSKVEYKINGIENCHSYSSIWVGPGSGHLFATMTFARLVCTFLLAAPLINCEQIGRGQEPIGPIDDFQCVNNGVFAYPDDCSQYVNCWMDEAVLWQCTDLMLFDLTYNGCNFAQYVHCDDRPRPTNVPSTQSTPRTTTPFTGPTTPTTPGPDPGDFVCPNDGTFANEERCEYYWECWAGEAVAVHCNTDFLFDRVYMGCNFPELTDCDHRIRPNDSTTTRPPTTRTTTLGTTVTTTRGTTSSDDPVTEPTIPSGPTTTANPNVTTMATTTTPSTTRRPGDEFECPPGVEGDFPDPLDCSWFYTCVGGVPYHNQCPAGLHFNPVTDSCDYPENVDCEDRPTFKGLI